MSITITIAQIRKIAGAADEEEIPDDKVVEIDWPSGADNPYSGEEGEEDVRAVREPPNFEQLRTGQPGEALFLLDGEGRRL